MNIIHAYAAQDAKSPLAPFEYKPRQLREHDIQIKVLYCGVCHSDLHQARNEWHNTVFPVVPGHEIVGHVVDVGTHVHKYQVGDLVGVGCMVDSCRTCNSCREDLEQYCEEGFVGTYNSRDRISGDITYGGYASQVMVHEDFVLSIPENIDPACAAPLLCAGITTFSPLKHWGVSHNKKVGIVGLGGLGHMGVKIAHAMGAHVVLFTTSTSKIKDGKRLGADEVVISKNVDDMGQHTNSFDFILNTVAAHHDLNPFIPLLCRDGTMALVGAPEHNHPSIQVFNLIFKRRSIAGSLIGSIKETQEMLTFCSKHNITPDIEMIKMSEINEAYERMLKNDVKYRFVIDIHSSLG